MLNYVKHQEGGKMPFRKRKKEKKAKEAHRRNEANVDAPLFV